MKQWRSFLSVKLNQTENFIFIVSCFDRIWQKKRISSKNVYNRFFRFSSDQIDEHLQTRENDQLNVIFFPIVNDSVDQFLDKKKN